MTDSFEIERLQAIAEYKRIVAEIGHQPGVIPPLPFPHLHVFLACTPVIERVRSIGAIILERRAWAGGATYWYYCPDEIHLKAIEPLLGAGSIVKFYFGQRIESAVTSPETKSKVIQLLSEIDPKSSCVFIGTLSEDCIHINMESIYDAEELDLPDHLEIEFTGSLRIFYGKETDDGDGFHTLQLTLPDSDGIVRGHPH